MTPARETTLSLPAPPGDAAGARRPMELDTCAVCGGTSGGVRTVVRAGTVSVCQSCGSWQRNPRPGFEELERIYDERYYDAWGLRSDESIACLSKEATFATLVDEIDRRLRKVHPPIRVLDVGAATGSLLDVAARRGWEPFAVELNPFAVGVLKERFGADRVFQGELTAVNWPEGTFDVITMTDLIEHVLDVSSTLRNAIRLLRPGGLLCLTTPSIDSWSRRLQGRRWLHFKEEHVQYFSRRGLRGALQQAGFVDVDIRPMWKRLTLDYVSFQLRIYQDRLLTPLIRFVSAVTPSFLRRLPLPYRCGEVRVIARKPEYDRS